MPPRARSSMTPSAISDASRAVEQLRAALLDSSLEQIEQCVPLLTEAAHKLRLLEHAAAGIPQTERAEFVGHLHRLQRQLASAARLTVNGLEFHNGWARLLSA